MSAPAKPPEHSRAVAAGSRLGARRLPGALDRIREPTASSTRSCTSTRRARWPARRSIDRRRDELMTCRSLGVPVAVKDNICTARHADDGGVAHPRGLPAALRRDVVERLEAAGAVIVGKTNCDEFAMGSSTENSAFGATRNPWDLERIPGGSSGGSAAAVAAGMVPLALGSETGGSIRQPAALCGVIGLKPTYGRVSRFGLIAFASSLDQIGPFAHDGRGRRAGLQRHRRTRSARRDLGRRGRPGLLSARIGDLSGLRVGVPRALISEGVEPDVLAAVEGAARARRRRARAGRQSTCRTPHGIPVYYLVANAEASSNLARYDGVRYGVRAAARRRPLGDDVRIGPAGAGFGAEVKRRIMLGTFVLSAGYYDAYYVKAQQVRAADRQDYDAAFERST